MLFLQRYWWSTNTAIWLNMSFLAYNLWRRIFPDMGFAQKNSVIESFTLGYFQHKIMTRFYKNLFPQFRQRRFFLKFTTGILLLDSTAAKNFFKKIMKRFWFTDRLEFTEPHLPGFQKQAKRSISWEKLKRWKLSKLQRPIMLQMSLLYTTDPVESQLIF